MTDPELIEAVAKRLGWTSIVQNKADPTLFYGSPPGKPNARKELPPWRTSVDAALGVLDKKIRLEIIWDINRQEFRLQYGGGEIQIAKSLKKLPRAILEAFLSVEKP